MVEAKSKKGVWYKCETIDGVITYTDSDGIWMKETYDKKGNIVYRENSYGDWTKFTYTKGSDKDKDKVVITQTKGTK